MDARRATLCTRTQRTMSASTSTFAGKAIAQKVALKKTQKANVTVRASAEKVRTHARHRTHRCAMGDIETRDMRRYRPCERAIDDEHDNT